MKTACSPKYVVGGLAAVILAGLLVCLIRSEGERTRQILRDSRREAEATPGVVPLPSPDKGACPADTSGPSSAARDKTPPAITPNQQQPGIATAADPKPSAAESEAGAKEDFSLDEHLVFPGLTDEVSKTRAKPRTDQPAGERKSATEEPNHMGSK